MRKLSITAAAAALVLTSLAFTAGAQTQQLGAASIHNMLRNATPIHKAACARLFGHRCLPGFTWVCRGGRCWCAPC
jgi:hypothetical protein